MTQHILTEEELFCLEGCRSYKQYHRMRQDFEGGKCAFCNPDPEINKILWEDDHVMAWHVASAYMREELRLHYMIVPKKHVRFETKLSFKAVESIHRAKRFMGERFRYQGGLTHVREGDMRLNAGTVPHLHYNIFEPNMTGEVRVPVFKAVDDREENNARSARFSNIFEKDVSPEEFEELCKKDSYYKDGRPKILP